MDKTTDIKRVLRALGYAPDPNDSGRSDHEKWIKPGSPPVPVPRHKVLSDFVMGNIERSAGMPKGLLVNGNTKDALEWAEKQRTAELAGQAGDPTNGAAAGNGHPDGKKIIDKIDKIINGQHVKVDAYLQPDGKITLVDSKGRTVASEVDVNDFWGTGQISGNGSDEKVKVGQKNASGINSSQTQQHNVSISSGSDKKGVKLNTDVFNRGGPKIVLDPQSDVITSKHPTLSGKDLIGSKSKPIINNDLQPGKKGTFPTNKDLIFNGSSDNEKHVVNIDIHHHTDENVRLTAGIDSHPPDAIDRWMNNQGKPAPPAQVDNTQLSEAHQEPAAANTPDAINRWMVNQQNNQPAATQTPPVPTAQPPDAVNRYMASTSMPSSGPVEASAPQTAAYSPEPVPSQPPASNPPDAVDRWMANNSDPAPAPEPNPSITLPAATPETSPPLGITAADPSAAVRPMPSVGHNAME
jgi:hypothetical protein